MTLIVNDFLKSPSPAPPLPARDATRPFNQFLGPAPGRHSIEGRKIHLSPYCHLGSHVWEAAVKRHLAALKSAHSRITRRDFIPCFHAHSLEPGHMTNSLLLVVAARTFGLTLSPFGFSVGVQPLRRSLTDATFAAIHVLHLLRASTPG
jgi:hypothetical protein